MTIQRIGTNARLSQAVIHGGVVYLSGQMIGANVEERSVAGQTGIVLAQIDRLLTAAGTGKEYLLSASVWLADISTFAEMNDVWERWLAPGCAPARATVEARLARPACLIEIAVTAAIP
jgi:enamine deaminase RidA (YjgF/YER057c/UK114 family)